MMDLNETQMLATNHNLGPMIVLAGPGSGKTTVIAHRVENLIKKFGVDSKKILVISFTKASAIDMEHRFNNLFRNENKVTFGTFHSVFFRIVRSKYGYQLNSILNEFEKNNILKSIAQEIGIEYDDEEEFLKNINLEISLIKNNLIELEHYNSMNFSSDDLKSIYRMYEDFKEEKNKIDFDDMLFKCYEILKTENSILEKWQNQYEYILIDEFQDINLVQYRCIQFLREKNRNIFVVGDDDQSIYKFRGANVEIMLNFEKDFENCKKVILNTNYRSTNEIIKLSNKIIGENTLRFEKTIIGTDINYKYPTMLKYEDVFQESREVAKRIHNLVKERGIDESEIAVIYRTNIQAFSLVQSLQDFNIPVVLKDSYPSIYSHFITKDIIAYMKLSMNFSDAESFKRIINKPKRFISKVLQERLTKDLQDKNCFSNIYKIRDIRKFEVDNLEALKFYLNGIKKRKPYDAIKYIRSGANYDDYILEYSQFKKVKPSNLYDILNELMESSKRFDDLEEFIDYCEKQRDNKDIENQKRDFKGVTLTTYHSAKGLEFDIVFLITLCEGVIPYEYCKTKSEIEEERRLFYVGLTRAKKELYLSTIKMRFDKEVSTSCFLDNLVKKRKGE